MVKSKVINKQAKKVTNRQRKLVVWTKQNFESERLDSNIKSKSWLNKSNMQ